MALDAGAKRFTVSSAVRKRCAGQSTDHLATKLGHDAAVHEEELIDRKQHVRLGEGDVDRVVGLLGNRFKPQLIINRLRPALVKKGKMLSVEDVNGILHLPLLGVIADEPEIIVTTNMPNRTTAFHRSIPGGVSPRVTNSLRCQATVAAADRTRNAAPASTTTSISTRHR